MKILVVDDHPLFREAISHLVRQLGAGIEVLTADGGEGALGIVQAHPDLDLALFDLNLPGEDGVAAIGKCRALRATLPVVVVSGSENAADVRRAKAAGARAYLPKSAPGQAMVDALRQVLAGEEYAAPAGAQAQQARDSGMTLRQMEVLALLCQGKSNKEIGRSLNLAEQTVKVHISAIFRALKVVNRTQAAVAARQIGIVAR